MLAWLESVVVPLVQLAALEANCCKSALMLWKKRHSRKRLVSLALQIQDGRENDCGQFAGRNWKNMGEPFLFCLPVALTACNNVSACESAQNGPAGS